ncbi:MAG: hypothetical protein AABN33_13370 [Acidobacteriota bacterium]
MVGRNVGVRLRSDRSRHDLLRGRDGKVRLPRVLAGVGKVGDAALVAARQWEFEPTTFEGHTVQVIETISFPAK